MPACKGCVKVTGLTSLPLLGDYSNTPLMNKMREPINLSEWEKPLKPQGRGRLFTCGRPGRFTFGREKRIINNETIDQWTHGLPQVECLYIVSLLGRKKNGYSEFSYYPFRSSKEVGAKPTFQDWLTERYGPRFIVHEFPTVDAMGVPYEIMKDLMHHIHDLIENGNTVLIMDSAGAERTARVCEAMGYKRMSRAVARED